MAYMNQERKALLKAEIDKVMPKGWKYTLAVRHHSGLVLTIKEATVDLIGLSLDTQTRYPVRPTRIDLNLFHLHLHYSGKVLKQMEAINAACNVGNHDNSDSQSDYFDIGWYVDINIGSDEKGFTYRRATRKRTKKSNTFICKKCIGNGCPNCAKVNREHEIEQMKNRIAAIENSLGYSGSRENIAHGL